MEDKNGAQIIIKRIKKVKKGGHHGGGWKIAYADFVTAMMAFFLIMWILSMLNKSQLRSVSEYFKDPKHTGLVEKGSRTNKDLIEENFLEKGVQKGTWKDVNKEKDKKKEDYKIKAEQSKTDSTKMPAAVDPIAQLKEIKRNLEESLAKNPELQQFKNNLNFIVTADGLKIILKDLENKPMFSRGKTDFEKYANNILTWLSNQLNQYPNQMIIIGHTDSVKFSGDQYTNWELSADRANATRRVLIKSGMENDKILRVIGEADKTQLDTNNGENPSNRRIDIIVLTDEAAKKVRSSPSADELNDKSHAVSKSNEKVANSPTPPANTTNTGSQVSNAPAPKTDAPAAVTPSTIAPPASNAIAQQQGKPVETTTQNKTMETPTQPQPPVQPQAQPSTAGVTAPTLSAEKMSLQNVVPTNVPDIGTTNNDSSIKMSLVPGAQ